MKIFYENRLAKIESDLFQIKILLAILIMIAFVGFHGLEAIVGVIGGIIFWTGMVLAIGYLFLLILEKRMGLKKSLATEKEFEQEILKELEAKRKNESS